MNLNRMRQLAGLKQLNEETEEVNSLNGFNKGDRVTAQDVSARPPQTYPGTIKSIFSDETAWVDFDNNLNTQAAKNLVRNGRVALHDLKRQAK